MDGKIEGMDRVSGLPEFILHHVLSFLRREEAARTCVLSKRWNCIWDSFPILDFNQRTYIKEGPSWEPEYLGKVRELMINVVDKSLQRVIQKNFKIQSFNLFLVLVDPNLVSMIDKWMELVLDNGAREIQFTVTKFSKVKSECYYILPETIFQVKSGKSFPRFYSLQKLILSSVYITENIIQDIIRNCPNITSFSLWSSFGFKTLEICNLHKLVSFTLGVSENGRELERVNISAPNLEKLSFISCVPNLPCQISFTSCYYLKELKLSKCSITDDILNLYISRFHLLEVLDISDCRMLRHIRIFAKRLRRLLLSCRDKIQVIEIDSPVLSSFKFRVWNMPHILSLNVPCPVEIEYYVNRYSKVDSSWFLKLREFLGFSSQLRKKFRLNFQIKKEVSFDLEDFGDVPIPPLIEVDNLEIVSNRILESVDCEPLIDGLLWSCHPRTISLLCDTIFRYQQNCIKLLREKLLDRKSPTCCDSTSIRCWRHGLKSAKIKVLGETEEDWLLDSNQLVDLPHEKDQELRFQLEWDY